MTSRRLLHAILTTATDDRIVRRNPCRIENAAKEDSPEREIVPLPIVFALANAVPVRYRALILLATFAGLRWGELAALRCASIDLDACEIRITETTAEFDKGGLLPDTPKSKNSRRKTRNALDVVHVWPASRFRLRCRTVPMRSSWAGTTERATGIARMTSLEGSGPLVPDQDKRRSGGMSACP